MDKNGINGRGLSHTQRMEAKNDNVAPTKANGEAKGLLLSPKDAEEYRAYRKQKKINEIMSAIARSETPIDVKSDAERIYDRAVRLRQAAVKVTPRGLLQAQNRLVKSTVKLDCLIGGDGEMLAKVKAYEARAARRLHASELTVVLPPSLLLACRYSEIKRELRKIKRAAKKVTLKVWIDKNHPYMTIARTARICCEVGAQYFCIPYFAGCERLRCDLTGGCKLEISEVETLDDFKKMTAAGVERIVTSHIWEIYSEWMKEAEKISFAVEKPSTPAPVKQETKALPVVNEPKTPSGEKVSAPPLTVRAKTDSETDYRCRLEGTELKFL